MSDLSRVLSKLRGVHGQLGPVSRRKQQQQVSGKEGVGGSVWWVQSWVRVEGSRGREHRSGGQGQGPRLQVEGKGV